MRSTVFVIAVALAGTAHAKGKKKDVGPPPPTSGWIQAEGALGACYVPPKFEELGLIERRAARNDAMEAMKSQWGGGREDGVSFDGGVIEGVETVLLGYPEKIEDVARKNADLCQAAMKGGGTDAWAAWLGALPAKLVQGECMRPLDTTMFWYLDIGMGWQGPAGICKGDSVRIWSSEKDYFRIDDGGPWINAAGDLSKPATGDGYVCTTEGCYAGTLVMRFRGDDGVEVVKPVGLDLKFVAPSHGQIEFTVNDTTYFNNVWKVERGMQHHTAVTYEPVE